MECKVIAIIDLVKTRRLISFLPAEIVSVFCFLKYAKILCFLTSTTCRQVLNEEAQFA